jgi:hypothetical protein
MLYPPELRARACLSRAYKGRPGTATTDCLRFPAGTCLKAVNLPNRNVQPFGNSAQRIPVCRPGRGMTQQVLGRRGVARGRVRRGRHTP